MPSHYLIIFNDSESRFDVETTSPEMRNRDFESRFCGHRAVMHGHIIQDGILWGTLEPCVFDHPGQWTQNEHIFIENLLSLLPNHVKEYVMKVQIDELEQPS
ncbi:unnamed protein product [Rotaria socialis]|uniref:Uncharacterized protein n=2 Tax=Rotaria socialis TaxID=392032 RepID=A0A817TFB9_9BILA|nr:unnamed protein product [Rotaria socialis]CAF3456714.1 unnamed protein product [Rotaria socialis]